MITRKDLNLIAETVHREVGKALDEYCVSQHMPEEARPEKTIINQESFSHLISFNVVQKLRYEIKTKAQKTPQGEGPGAEGSGS